MSNRTHVSHDWNAWNAARGLLDPLRFVWSGVRARREDEARRRERMMMHTTRCCDAEILELVERRLAEDEALRGSEIHVEAVYDGVVVLGGSAATVDALARAFDDAASVSSVRRVRTEITTENREQDAA